MATPNVFQVPPLNKRKRIPMKTIRALANHIAKKFNPEEIILFGSHAYGKPTAWSDVDLLIAMDTPKGEQFEKSLEIRKTIPELTFVLDVIVRSRKVIERRKNWGIGFWWTSLKKEKPCMNEVIGEFDSEAVDAASVAEASAGYLDTCPRSFSTTLSAHQPVTGG